MSQALYRRWRSQNFDEVVGQEHVTQTLRNALRDGRAAHAYLFAGPRGTGKTSTARILAKALNCDNPKDGRPCNQCPSCRAISEGRMIDLIEIDAASNNGVEDIRELRDKVGFRPSEGRFKIYIIDEVHMLSVNAFNALLKTLEEPPPHARFVLATTEPHKIPATVLSRCQRFDFRRIPANEIAEHLRHIVQAEHFQAEDEALMAIARSAQGGMRDAVSLLDQMVSFGAESVTLAQVQESLGAVSEATVQEMVEALATQQAAAGLRLIQQLVLAGSSLTEFCHQVVEYLRGVMVLQMAQDPALLHELPAETVGRMQTHAQQMQFSATLFAVKRFSEAMTQLKGSHQPQLPLELALIEAIQGEPAAGSHMDPTVASTVGATVTSTVENGGAHAGAAAPGHRQGAVPMQGSEPDAARTPASTSAASSAPGQASTQSASAESSTAKHEPGEAAAPPPLDEAAVHKLRGQWKAFAAEVKNELGMKVWAAINSVRDIAVAEHGVAFAFGNNGFAQQMLAEAENHGRVTKILSDFLGRPVQLECQLGEQARLTGSGAVVAQNQEQDDTDPLVDYAVNTLGAEVVD